MAGYWHQIISSFSLKEQMNVLIQFQAKPNVKALEEVIVICAYINHTMEP